MNGYQRLIAEIPGSDRADEIVAHRRALRFLARGRDGGHRQRRRERLP